jgi:hypothetical protein
MAYETQCGGCIEYDYQGDNVKGYCSYYKCYYYPGDGCSHQRPRESSSSCYITTIICDVLGFSDDAGILNTLRGFRDNVMQKDSKYFKTLLEYDVVGPVIAKFIKEEYNNTHDDEMWIQFYNFYLSPTANLIKEEKYDEAVLRYKEMVESLKDYYGIEKEVNIIEDYDMSKGGHGKVKFLKKQEEI